VASPGLIVDAHARMSMTHLVPYDSKYGLPPPPPAPLPSCRTGPVAVALVLTPRHVGASFVDMAIALPLRLSSTRQLLLARASKALESYLPRHNAVWKSRGEETERERRLFF